jgi:hypothetical protein
MTTYNSWGWGDQMGSILYPNVPVNRGNLSSSSIAKKIEGSSPIDSSVVGITNYLRTYDNAIDRTGLVHPYSPTPQDQRLRIELLRKKKEDYNQRYRSSIERAMHEGKSIFSLAKKDIPGKEIGGKDHLVPTVHGLIGLNSPIMIKSGKRHYKL